MPKRGQLTKDQLEQLGNVLSGPKITPVQKGEKVEYLEDYFEADLNPNPEGGKRRGHDDDDYEDEGGHGGR